MIYIDHPYRLPEELVDFLATLLPNMITEVSLSDNRTILLLDQSEPIEVEELVKDVLPTLESDFGIKLTVFLAIAGVNCKQMICKLISMKKPSFFLM